MKRLRILAPCIVASLLIGLSATATASAAAPEIGRCIKVAKGQGKYKDPGCEKGKVKSGGTFEWLPGFVKGKFVSHEGVSTFETVKGLKMTCTSDNDLGEYINPKEDREAIFFNECFVNGVPCSTRPGGTGIETTVLRSVLGFIKAPKQVGVDLESATGAPFASFMCGGVAASITGSVIGPVGPISQMSTTFTIKFQATKGKQKPEKFQGRPKDTLICNFGGKSEQCGFTSEDVITNEEPLEINEVL